ncbi:PAS domain-containing SpoIIE family protein phosphatase/ATP-binding protein [Streptomyces sp. NBC_01275]|uniref:SpoIIE family protein phosphatase n=1 Tax=Streptomyces sp. NBC_01275 TaxID=2903807 RepID=UPI002258608E|nr:SpoIIE family protein phosphatase [Streptomyces sp. NBC_01275]MCX4760327.1 PAS domain-containing SpoIIE family protein phosphatase/ATP-binding protein [Streptomyces sp. NBC_01275]
MGTHDEDDVARRPFDVADAAPLLLDARGLVTGWTRDAQRLLGYPAVEAVGRELAGLLGAADAGRVPDVLARCRSNGGWTGLLTARHQDGRPVPVMARVISAQEPDPPEPPDAPEAPDAPGRRDERGVHGEPARWLVLLSDVADAPGWNMNRSVLEQMLDDAPIGIAIVDTDLRYVWSNTALARFGGGPPAHRLGLRLADVQPGLDSAAVEAQMRRVLASGEPVVDYEHLGRVRAAPHRETAHMLSFTRLDDDQGHPLGVYYTVVDMTDRHRARQRLALLDRAGRRIGRSLDIVRTAQELADVAVPVFADAVVVDLLEPVLRGAEPAPGQTDAGPHASVALRRAGRRTDDGLAGAPAEEETPGRADRVPSVVYPAGSPPVRCLLSGRPWLTERVDPPGEEWVGGLLGESEPPSALIVPVRARGATLGVTTFLRRPAHEPFGEDDLALAEDLVSRAAVCVDNARRYTRERDAALVLQRNLLPRRLPEQDAVEVAACYRPADELTGLGGDWYDLIPLSAARVALVVGEVPGHGIAAAAAMGRVRTAVRTLAALDLPPEEILAHLDDLVARMDHEEGGWPQDVPQTVGCGCVYVVYDPVDGRCAMAAAGHPAPAVVLPDGTVTFVELPQGPPLGAGGPPFESVEVTLPEGSTLALHTDGLLLAEGEQWALDTDRNRLRQALERPEARIDLRCRTVIDALVPARPHDDVALLMARTRRLEADRVADWELPADPAAVAEARKTASRRLAEWGLSELSFTTELVVSELVTNAIRYATGPIRLRLIRERTLVCEVFDGGATAPHLRHPRATDEGGRGLLLVSQVTQRWGTRFLPEGKIIWAEQSLTDPGM